MRCPKCEKIFQTTNGYCPNCKNTKLISESEFKRLKFGKPFWEKTPKEQWDEDMKNIELRNKNKQQSFSECIPKCPVCQSTNLTKISAADKVVGATLFGLFSKTAKSQFKCENCGYKF